MLASRLLLALGDMRSCWSGVILESSWGVCCAAVASVPVLSAGGGGADAVMLAVSTLCLERRDGDDDDDDGDDAASRWPRWMGVRTDAPGVDESDLGR